MFCTLVNKTKSISVHSKKTVKHNTLGSPLSCLDDRVRLVQSILDGNHSWVIRRINILESTTDQSTTRIIHQISLVQKALSLQIPLHLETDRSHIRILHTFIFLSHSIPFHITWDDPQFECPFHSFERERVQPYKPIHNSRR